MNNKIRFHTNGYSGVGRALSDIYRELKYNLFIRVNHLYQVDDGILPTSNGPLYISYANVEKTLNFSTTHLIFFRSVLPERLNTRYASLRKLRKPVWLIDLDLQPVQETVKIFNRSHYRHYWTNNITIHGSTATEDPEIYNVMFKYFIQLLQQIE